MFETMFGISVWLVFICVVDGFNVNQTIFENDTKEFTELDLHEELFKRYNRNVMPKMNKTNPICVTLELYLLSVDEIDEKQQTIRIRAFLELKWVDEFLAWDANKYPDITHINVKVDEIWYPDLALDNSFGKLGHLGQEGGNAVVNQSGGVVIWPYSSYMVACKISISRFPFDEQRCNFSFSSWTNTNAVLKLRNTSGKVSLDRYAESGEWELTEGLMKFRESPYGDDFYDKVSFEICLKRKPLFYVMNIMAPVLCISLLNIFCFILPSQDGERVTLSISIFLTLAVFLTIVNNTMPESSDEASKFGVYLGLQLFGNALTIAMTTISLYVFHRSEKRKIPKIFKLLVKVTCITLPEEKNVLFRLAMNVTAMYGKKENNRKLDGVLVNSNKCEDQVTSRPSVLDNTASNHTTMANRANINEEQGAPRQNIPNNGANNHTGIQNKSPATVEEEPSDVTWKMVSVAMDRFWLVCALSWHVVLLVTLIGSIAS